MNQNIKFRQKDQKPPLVVFNQAFQFEILAFIKNLLHGLLLLNVEDIIKWTYTWYYQMTHTFSLCRIREFTFHLKFWKIWFLFHIFWHTLSRLEASKFAIDSFDCFEIFSFHLRLLNFKEKYAFWHHGWRLNGVANICAETNYQPWNYLS